MNTKFFSQLAVLSALFAIFIAAQPVEAASFSYTAAGFQSIACPSGDSYTPMNLVETGDIATITGTGFGVRDVNDLIPESTYIPVGATVYNIYRGQRIDANSQTIYFGLQSWVDNSITLEVTLGQGGSLGSTIVLRTYASQTDNDGSCVSATLSPTPPPPPAPALCTTDDYFCSEWAACSISGGQTRVCNKISGCDGGVTMPITSQSCVYTPPMCSSWTYLDWLACGLDGQQTRAILTSSPDGCIGGSPILTQACVVEPPTAPIINSISPNILTPGETIVTIYGQNFGNSYSIFDNQICFSEYCISSLYLSDYVSKWTDTEIQVRAPSFIGESGGSISIRAYFAATKKYDFVVGPSYTVKKVPVIILYYPNMFQGDSYKFSGKNFGQTQGKAVLNGIETEIISWNDNEVTFKVPPKAYSGQIYFESSDGVKSTPISISILKKYSNDEYSFYQWYLESLNIDKAWEITEGSSDVVVAVIDSGVDINHEDLKDAIWKNQNEIVNNGIDDDFNGYVDDSYGWDFVLESSSTGARGNHGTAVASLIAAKKNNGVGIAGVAPGVKIMALNVSAVEDGTMVKVDAANEAIKYAVDNGADIINLSFVGDGNSILYEASLKYAYENNVLVVAAAGNASKNLDESPSSPVCVDLKHNAVIGVASTNKENLKSDFSNYGQSCVDLSAPGEHIAVAFSSSSDNYSIASGTSFSAPLVSGIAALIKSKNPDWNIEEIKKVLLDTAASVDSSNPFYANKMGRGLPSAYLALNASRPDVSYDYNPNSKLILKETGLTIKIEEPELKPIEGPTIIKSEPPKIEPPKKEVLIKEGIVKNEKLVQSYFPDIKGDENEIAINYLKSKGVVNGYPDGTFRPEKTLNRAELLKIVVLAKYPEPTADFDISCFKDIVRGAWYAVYVCFAKENSIVQGYSNGNFQPGQKINYVEALKIALETMGYSPAKPTKIWYQAYLDKASSMNVGLDTLSPEHEITRGEMAQLITNVMKYK